MSKLLLSVFAIVMIAGCNNVKYEDRRFNIKEDCVKTNLWVTRSGHAGARPVYDCSGALIEDNRITDE